MTELPKGWALATVNDLIGPQGLFVDGDWVESKDQDPGGEVRLTQLADVGEGQWRNRSDRYLTAPTADRLGCSYLEVDDVLVARMPDPLGRACLFPGDRRPCVTVVDVAIVRPGPDSVRPRWLMWAMNSPAIRAAIEAQQAGTTRKRISRKNLGQIELQIPPLAEQERIVTAIEEAFSKLDAGEAGLRTVRQLLKRMRDAILTAAVTGRLVPQDPTDTPAAKLLADLGAEALEVKGAAALPPGWVWGQLGDLSLTVRNGVFVSRPAEDPPGVPILRIGAVRPLHLDWSDVRYAPVDIDDPAIARGLLAEGDLLFTRYNGNPAFVGACALVSWVPGPVLHPDKLIRVAIDSRAADPAYVAIAASTGWSREFISAATKTTAGQAGISGGELKQVPVPLAPIEEQTRIVAEVERQLSFVEACERAVDVGLARAGGLRRSVLKAAFEGRLVPQDPSDEPASVLLDRIRAERAAQPVAKRRARVTA
jgi:type I restriction enzyme S subunit